MSDPVEDIASERGVAVRREGSLSLICFQDCGTILEACKSHGLLILGIAAFTLSGGKVIPDIDLIADFSELAAKEWNAACLEAVKSAESYFDKVKSRTDLWFNFTLQQRASGGGRPAA
jgi:hypothetical protein